MIKCSANLTKLTSNSTDVILSTSFHNRTRPISANSGHCNENCTWSHLENEVTVSSKTTTSKPIRKSFRQNMTRNINVYNKHVKKRKKEYKIIQKREGLCVKAEDLGTLTTRKLWAQGIVHPGSKRLLTYLRARHLPFGTEEINQLDKDITEFGRSAAGAVLTQIARYSLVLNQANRVSNEGFICVFTQHVIGSYRPLFRAGRNMNELSPCPCLKKKWRTLQSPPRGILTPHWM